MVSHEDVARESFWTKHHEGSTGCTKHTDALEGARSQSHKFYEHEDEWFPETWMVLHLDGQCFHKYVWPISYLALIGW